MAEMRRQYGGLYSLSVQNHTYDPHMLAHILAPAVSINQTVYRDSYKYPVFIERLRRLKGFVAGSYSSCRRDSDLLDHVWQLGTLEHWSFLDNYELCGTRLH